MSRAFSYNNNSIIFSNILSCAAPDDESKILAWLSPLVPWVRHQDIRAQLVGSVGGWLLETKEFRRWRGGGTEGESDHAVFCDDNPGAGKSCITSPVIDKLCDEATREDIAVTCFYFDFAARNEQSPINILGSLLRQLVSGLGGIPEVVVQSFRNEKKVIGGRGLQVSGISRIFRAIAATKRTFICVDAVGECAPERRTVVFEILQQILQGSPNTRIFMTGRAHVRSKAERKFDGAESFILIQPPEDGVVGYLRGKLGGGTTPDIMGGALEAGNIKSLVGGSSETFLLASLHIDATLRETIISRRGKRFKSIKDRAELGDAYDATLERIKAQEGEKKKKLQ